MPDPIFHNKVALVTGASSGIGQASALALANRGACVALAARRTSALERLAAEIHSKGSQAMVLTVDMTERGQVDNMIQEILQKWGQVDFLIVNAGQYLRSPIVGMDVSILQRALDINFFGSVYPIVSLLPHMLERGSGHIVAISTVDAKKALPPDAPYVASKSAMSGFMEVLRQELHGTGVSASTIFPGRVDTPMIENLKVPWISAKISSEAVAQTVIKAIKNRKPEIILPQQSKLLIYLNVFFPSLADWVVRYFHLEGWETLQKDQ